MVEYEFKNPLNNPWQPSSVDLRVLSKAVHHDYFIVTATFSERKKAICPRPLRRSLKYL